MERFQAIRKLWKGYQVDSTDALDKYLSHYRVLFAYHSGKIENDEITYHDTREIFENGKVTGFTGNPRALFEQQNQKICYEILKQKIVDKEPITLSLVREIHSLLTAGTYDERRYVDQGERPGEFKKHDYVTGIHEVGSRPDQVENDMQDLLEEINAYQGQDVLKAASYFHARFEFIHPFADGNGRVGRTLLNYYLMTKDEPPLIIYEEDRKQYYASLEAYDAQELIAPLADFLQEATVKTWNSVLERALGKDKQPRSRLDGLHR